MSRKHAVASPAAAVAPFAGDEITRRIRELGPWFHNINLAGVQTAPDHFLGDYPNVKWRAFAHAIPADLHGMTVLDVGCNGGFYAIEMKRRGADRVVALEPDAGYLAQARFAAEVSGADIEFHSLSVYDVARLQERFDLVLFLGVFYHLRHPLLALDLLQEHVARGLLVFQSLIRGASEVESLEPDYNFWEKDVFDRPAYPKLHFVEHSYSNDPTNWWIPNRACVEAMLRSAGFELVGQPEPEVFVCRRVEKGGRQRDAYPSQGRRP